MQHNGMVQRKRTVANLRVDAEGLSVSLSGTEVATAAYHGDMQACPSPSHSHSHTYSHSHSSCNVY